MTRVAREIQAILRDATGFVGRHRLRFAATLAATAAVTVLLMPADARLLGEVQQWSAAYGNLAEVVSRIGRFENSSLAFAVIAAVIGLVARSMQWRDIAVACLLAGIVAGLTVNVLRPTFGRARPHANVEAGFYWFELEAQLHSMPSGHVMSNAASAWAIVPLAPVAVVPAVAYTGLMAWSRMRLNRHYPTDVLWGSVLGALVGVAIGAAIRDRRRGSPSRSTGQS